MSVKETKTDQNRLDEATAEQSERVLALQHAVSRRRPILANILRQYGDRTMAEYTADFGRNEAEPIQPREEVTAVIHAYADRLLGKDVADRLADRLARRPGMLTANHHGVDSLALTIQGDLAYALSEEPGSVMPIVAGGIIPLNNITAARGGVTLSRERSVVTKIDGQKTAKFVPIRINIFPGNEEERLVYATPAFTEKLANGAFGDIDKLASNREISPDEQRMLRWIIKQDYRNQDILNQATFSDQAVLLNARLLPKMFAKDIRGQMPDIAYLEMEQIVARLLENDLSNGDSLVYQLMFDPDMRQAIMHHLNGVYGCWETKALQSLNSPALKGNTRKKLLAGAGSAFFSGMDAKGRRIPLELITDNDKLFLSGHDEEGNPFSTIFTPDAIIQGLQEKQLIPTLFTSYAELAFAHGMRCHGGFMQTDYLTAMKHGLSDTLVQTGHIRWAEQIATVPTENYSTGMSVVMSRYTDGTVKPAGLIEMMVHGGLTAEELDKIRRISVRDANALTLPDIYSKVYRLDERAVDLSSITSSDIYATVGQGMVEFSLA